MKININSKAPNFKSSNSKMQRFTNSDHFSDLNSIFAFSNSKIEKFKRSIIQKFKTQKPETHFSIFEISNFKNGTFQKSILGT